MFTLNGNASISLRFCGKGGEESHGGVEGGGGY